jgi:hypothetical protein
VLNDLEKAVDGVSDLPQDLIDDPKFLEIKSCFLICSFALIVVRL